MEGKDPRIEYRMIEVEEQSLEELIDDNKGYLDWLGQNISPEAREQYKTQLERLIAEAPPARMMKEILVVPFSKLRFWPYTTSSKGNPEPKDPINLIFWNNAKADTVHNIMEQFIPPFLDTKFLKGLSNCASAQYTYVDNSELGGYVGWVKMSSSLSNCVCAGWHKRCHIRLFDLIDKDPTKGYVSIGAVHYEEWEWQSIDHIIKDWDRSQYFVDNLFDPVAFSFVGSKTTTELQPKGEVLQGVQHDGVASAIELKSTF